MYLCFSCPWVGNKNIFVSNFPRLVVSSFQHPKSQTGHLGTDGEPVHPVEPDAGEPCRSPFGGGGGGARGRAGREGQTDDIIPHRSDSPSLLQLVQRPSSHHRPGDLRVTVSCSSPPQPARALGSGCPPGRWERPRAATSLSKVHWNLLPPYLPRLTTG